MRRKTLSMLLAVSMVVALGGCAEAPALPEAALLTYLHRLLPLQTLLPHPLHPQKITAAQTQLPLMC